MFYKTVSVTDIDDCSRSFYEGIPSVCVLSREIVFILTVNLIYV